MAARYMRPLKDLPVCDILVSMRRQLSLNKVICASYLLLLIILCYFAGFKFPVPWDDEAFFLLQAYSFAKTNSLLSPYLSPERVVMWIPPGYLILMGMIFKLTAFSLRSARFVSLLFTFLSFTFVVKIIDVLKGNTFLKLAMFLFFLHPTFIAMANVGRQEAVYFALAIMSLYLLLSGRHLSALSVAAFSGLFHFNGIYVTVLSLIVIAVSCVKNRGHIEKYITSQCRKMDLLIFTVTVLAWCAYAALAISNFNSLINDMTFQFAIKLSYPSFLKSYRSIGFLFFFCLILAYSLYRQRYDLATISGFSLACYILNGVGHMMWYGVFFVLAFSFSFIASYLLLKEERFTVARAVIMVLIAVIPLSVITETAHGYSFFGMKYRFKGVYLTTPERNYVEGSLLAIQKMRNSAVPLTVRFIKSGDGLLFLEFLEKNNFRLIQNLPIVRQRKADIEVYINKKYYNPGWIYLMSTERYRDTENIRIFFKGSFYSELKSSFSAGPPTLRSMNFPRLAQSLTVRP
jgi:hypothetical protein